MIKLLIVDRDGVLNYDSAEFIKSPDEWLPIPGSMEALARANSLGYRVIVVTNQSGLARGLFDIDQLNAIHSKMYREVEQFGGRIDAVIFCPHGPDAGCECRKPKPGMLLEAGKRLGVSLSHAEFVGDRASDMEAASAAGAKRHLVRTGHGEETLTTLTNTDGITIHDDLAAVVAHFEATKG